MKYVYVNTGEEWMDDEPYVVGPFDTEEQANAAAKGRVVMALMPTGEDEW
jgi:hypothetical protein